MADSLWIVKSQQQQAAGGSELAVAHMHQSAAASEPSVSRYPDSIEPADSGPAVCSQPVGQQPVNSLQAESQAAAVGLVGRLPFRLNCHGNEVLSKLDVHSLRVCTGYTQKSKALSPSLICASRTNSMRDRLSRLHVQPHETFPLSSQTFSKLRPS